MPSKLLSVAVAALVLIAAAPASAHTLANWDKKQQTQVVKAGLMQRLPDGFEGDQPLTSGDLTQAFAALSAQTGTPAPNRSAIFIGMSRPEDDRCRHRPRSALPTTRG